MLRLLALIGVLSAVAGAAAAEGEPDLAGLHARLEADCAAGRFSGVVVGAKAGQVVFRHACGYSDVEARTPMTADARFKILSTSKPLTATAVLTLVEQGRMRLDDPIGRYVAGTPAAWDGVTVRQLMTHVSGVPDLSEALLEAYLEHGQTDHAGAMAYVLAHLAPEQAALATAPGAAWKYSNFGYELLAQAVASADGRPFSQALQALVLAAAGMKTATVEAGAFAGGTVQPAADPGLAKGYNGEPGRLEPAFSYSFVQQGAGAVHAGVDDLLALDAALRRGVPVSAASQARGLAEAFQVKPEVSYGYGWMERRIGGRRYAEHSGGTNGYVAQFARGVDDDVVVVALSNFGFAKTNDLTRDLLAALMGVQADGAK